MKKQEQSQMKLIQQDKPYAATLTDLSKSRIMSKYNISEEQWAMYDAEISIGLFNLRTAFPARSRNYSDREHDAL